MKWLLFGLLFGSPAIEPVYLCQGIGPDGAYQSSFTVQVMGDNYFVAWPDLKTIGMGFRSKNDFSAVYLTPNGQVGTALYRIKNKKLEGSWTGGDKKVYREVCEVSKGGSDAKPQPKPSSVREV